MTLAGTIVRETSEASTSRTLEKLLISVVCASSSYSSTLPSAVTATSTVTMVGGGSDGGGSGGYKVVYRPRALFSRERPFLLALEQVLIPLPS